MNDEHLVYLDYLEQDDHYDHRATAADWHGGQATPLYAYASTGSILRGLDREIRDCLDSVEKGQIIAETDAVAEHERLLALLHHVEPELAMIEARDIGRQHGESAAAWWQQYALGGRATSDVTPMARRVLQGIEGGDPAILDALPGPLEDYTAAELEDDCRWEEPDLDDRHAHARWQAARPALWDAYQQAFQDSVTEAVADACRFELTAHVNAHLQRLDAVGIGRDSYAVQRGLGL